MFRSAGFMSPGSVRRRRIAVCREHDHVEDALLRDAGEKPSAGGDEPCAGGYALPEQPSTCLILC